MTQNEPDYHTIRIPEDKDPSDYKWPERRAEILQIIERRGDPHTVNQTALADRYGVTQSQISKDIKKLGEHVRTSLGNKAEMTAWAAFKAALADCDDAMDRFDLVMKWMDWLQVTGRQETAAMKHEVEQTMIDGDVSDSYEIVARDESLDADEEVIDVASVRTTPPKNPDADDGVGAKPDPED